MKKNFLTMTMLLLASFILLAQNLSAQKPAYLNGTQQIANSDFELWDGSGTSVEPANWNSFMTAECTGLVATIGCNMVKSQKVFQESDPRTGSKGLYSARIISNTVLGFIKANANLTTGRISAGSTTATNTANFNYTERNNTDHSHPFTGTIPDSVVVWVKFSPKNNNEDDGSFEVIFHGDFDTKAATSFVPGPVEENSQLSAYARVLLPRNDNPEIGWKLNTWIRLSTPIEIWNDGNVPVAYCMVNATNSKLAGGGAGGDELWIDDMMFIYNPAIAIGTCPARIEVATGGNGLVNIPYTITGTMNPQNQEEDNRVIVEMSDINGSFDNPTIIGEVTAFESGKVECTVPYTLTAGSGYRIRIRTTNYPLTSDDNGVDIEIVNVTPFNVDAKVADECITRGTISGNVGIFPANTPIMLNATAKEGNHFTHWTLDGDIVKGQSATGYAFNLEKDVEILAYFDTNEYSFKLTEANSTMGSYTGTETGIYKHNYEVELHAVPIDTNNYKFAGYYEDGVLQNANAYWSFPLTRNIEIEGRFNYRTYNITANALKPGYSTIADINGKTIALSYLEKTILTATLRPSYAGQYDFVAWINTNNPEDTLGKTNTLEIEVDRDGINVTAIYRLRYYNVCLKAVPAAGGEIKPNITSYALTPVPAWDSLTGSRCITWAADHYTFDNNETGLRMIPEAKVGYRLDRLVDDSTGEVIAAPYLVVGTNNAGTRRVERSFDFTAHFVKQFTVSANALPATGGTISGAGIKDSGTMVNLTASPEAGYNFVAWEDSEGNVLSTEQSITFNAVADTSFNVRFELFQQDITITADNTDGEVSFDGTTYSPGDTKTVEYNTQVAIYARPVTPDFEFTGWEKAGVPGIFSTDNPFTYIAIDDDNFTAKFSNNIATIGAIASPADYGKVTGAGKLEKGTSANLTAVANVGYMFKEWQTSEGTTIGSVNPLEFEVAVDTAFVAVFDTATYNFSITNTTQASGCFDVVLDGTTVEDCAQTYTEILTHNNVVEIIAKPNYGYVATFGGLTTVTGEVNEQVRFAEDTFTLTTSAKPANLGSTKIVGNTQKTAEIPYNHSVTVEATANDHVEFVNWTVNGTSTVFSTDKIVTLNITRDTNIVANFNMEKFDVTIKVADTLMGKVNYLATTDAKIDTAIEYDKYISFTANPLPGYKFTGWRVDGEILSTSAAWNLTITKEVTIVAEFEALDYFVSVSVDLGSSAYGNVTGGGSYPYGSTATVHAVSNDPRYIFEKWTLTNGDSVSNEKDYSFVVKGDATLVAHFAIEIFNIAAVAEGGVGGSVAGGGDFEYGTQVSLNATPSTGYTFTEWRENGSRISTSNPYIFNATADRALEAVFTAQTFSIDISTQPTGADALTSGEGSYSYGRTVEMIAASNDIYTFLRWETLESDIFTPTELLNDTLYYVVEKSISLTAVYETKLYNVTAAAFPAEGGTVNNTSSHVHGSTVNLQAVPSAHYHFVSWLDTKDSSTITDNPLIIDFLDRDRDFVAFFAIDTHEITVICSPAAGGVVSGSGFYGYGDTITISVTLNPGYVFNNVWRDKYYTIISTEQQFKYVVEENDYIVASLGAVGNEDIAMNEHIRVYPNPTSGTVYIDGIEKISEIFVFSSNGTLIERRTLGADNSIDLSKQPAGVYLLRVGNQSIRIVKK